MNKKVKLLRAVLASTCLLVPQFAHAVFTISANVVDQTVKTDEDGVMDPVTNTIAATGTINESQAGVPGVDVINSNNIISIATTDPALPAIVSTAAGVSAINVQNAGTSTDIRIGALRSVTATGAASNGITFDADLGTVTNNGTIEVANGIAISALAQGTNLTVNNTATGLISSAAGGAAINVAANNVGTGFSLFNEGFGTYGIVNASAVATVNVGNTKVNNLTNTGDIINGLNGGGSAVSLVTVSGTTFLNTGLLQNDAAAGTVTLSGATITNGFVNTGTITNLTPNQRAVSYAGASATTFYQQGGTVNGDVFLKYNGNGTVFEMSGGVINGNVTDDSAGTTTSTLVDGTITGTFTAGAGNNGTYTVNIGGGSIGGTTTLNSTSAGTVNLSGGTIANLNLTGGNHTLNLSGGSAQNIAGDGNNQTINFSGGTYNTIDGMGGANVLNVTGYAQTTGTIANMDTTNVKASIFDVMHTMTGIDTALNVTGTMNTKANITGAGTFTNDGRTKVFSGNQIMMGGLLTNNGLLQIDETTNSPNSPVTVTGVTNSATGTIFVGVSPFGGAAGCPSLGTGVCGAINAGGGGTTLNGSIVGDPVGEFIANGTIFDVVTNTGAQAGAPNVSANSAVMNFTGQFVGTNYQITAVTIPFSNLPTSTMTLGVANALDSIVDSIPLPVVYPIANVPPPILDLLGQLQTITTAAEVETALRSLVPNFNHSITTMSTLTVRRAFDDIGMRLEELQGITPLLEEVDQKDDTEDLDGWNYGDPLLRHKQGAWVKPYASVAHQQRRGDIEGYRGDITGISFGGDWRILDWAAVGMAGSFAKTDITQRGQIDAKQKIDSMQVSFYGQFDPYGPLYLNTLLGIARHKYNIHRTISVGTIVQQPQSSYSGMQYAGKIEGGYAYYNGKYYVNPVAALEYMRLVQENYSEVGVPLGLTVRNTNVTEFAGSVGLKLAMQNEFLEATYIPEVTGLVRYDFVGDAQETFNNFIAGGPTFKSIGIKPDRTSYIFNAGIRIHTYHDSMFKIAYELEAKSQFLAHSVLFKWYYKWR